MTKTKVLKKFFKKFFNYDAAGNSSTQVINDFVENNESIPGGGSGDGGLFVINISPPTNPSGVFTMDKTFEEIKNAYEARKVIIIQGAGIVTAYYDANHNLLFAATWVSMNSSNLNVSEFKINSDNTINLTSRIVNFAN